MADQVPAKGFFTADKPGLVRPSGPDPNLFLRSEGGARSTPLFDGDHGDIVVAANGDSLTIEDKAKTHLSDPEGANIPINGYSAVYVSGAYGLLNLL